MSEQGKTLAEKVADEIFNLVQDRHYAPGVKLPTEKELCVMMKAGRNTVREALKILASRNVVVIRQGSGTFISDKQGVSDDPFGFAMTSDPKKLTNDLIQIRVIIEPPISALAAQCATPQDIAELEVILDKMESVIRKRAITPRWTSIFTRRSPSARTTLSCRI
jgi:DNA-binding FadR family transcriptional regulator